MIVQKKKLNINAKPFHPEIDYQYSSVHMSQQNISAQPKPIENNTLKPKKKQKSKSPQKTNDVLVEPKLELDPKYGYWTYTFEQRNEFKKMHQQYLQQKAEQENRLKEKVIEEQLKRVCLIIANQARAFALLKQKKLKRRDPLGMIRVNKIVYELKIKQGKFNQKQKETQKEYIIQTNEDKKQEIVEKTKIKKPSKLKKVLQSYQSQLNKDAKNLNQDSDFYTVDESVEENQFQKNQTISTTQKKINLMTQTNPISNTEYHKMKIRCWVQMIPCKEVDDQALLLINQLSLMQAKKKVMEPKKFKKRLVAGFSEVQRTLTTIIPEKLSKLIIIAINIIECPLEFGIDHQILQILRLCHERDIKVVHASNRSKIGRAYCGKFGPKIAVVSIINYQGIEDKFQELDSLRVQQEEEYIKQYGLINLNKINQL